MWPIRPCRSSAKLRGVFFTDDVGFIYKAPLMKKATVTEIARAQTGTTSIAGDDANAYWATGDCAIMTAPVK